MLCTMVFEKFLALTLKIILLQLFCCIICIYFSILRQASAPTEGSRNSEDAKVQLNHTFGALVESKNKSKDYIFKSLFMFDFVFLVCIEKHPLLGLVRQLKTTLFKPWVLPLPESTKKDGAHITPQSSKVPCQLLKPPSLDISINTAIHKVWIGFIQSIPWLFTSPAESHQLFAGRSVQCKICSSHV